jgi:hypothetical protein
MIGVETTARGRCPMSRQDQINLLKRLLHYVETRTTAMADSPWRNEVSVYSAGYGLRFGLARAGEF